jgi:hypothetical protein
LQIKKNKILWILFSFHLLCLESFSQTFSESNKETQYNVSAFLDLYYLYDQGRPAPGKRLPFVYNHTRHNELSVNLGYVKIQALHEKYRANIALMTGSYSHDNYESEPGLLKRIFELNAGFTLNKKNNLWLDLGVFSSHIGFENAVSKDNYNLSRSLAAENSPYYLAGAKLTYKPTERLETALLLCNGWQRIMPVPGNTLPGLGTQVQYTIKKTLFNWSTFTGTDDPDSLRRIRNFNNFYLRLNEIGGFHFIFGFDYGLQQSAKNNNSLENWHALIFTARYSFSERWSASMRLENYTDKKGIIINSYTNGFQVNGASLNIDFQVSKNVLWRAEAKTLNSVEKIFRLNSSPSNFNYSMMSSVAISL